MNFEVQDYTDIPDKKQQNLQDDIKTLNLLKKQLLSYEGNEVIDGYLTIKQEMDALEQEIELKKENMLWTSLMYCRHIVVDASDKYPNVNLRYDKPIRACVRCELTNAYSETYNSSILGSKVEKFNSIYLAKGKKNFKVDIKDIKYLEARELYQEVITYYPEASKEEIIKRMLTLQVNNKNYCRIK